MVTFTVWKGSENGNIVQDKTTREIKSDEVLIKVTHSGLCYTDVLFKKTGCVLGHEGTGLVEELGKDVRGFVKGDLVGWGYQHNSCGNCKQCLTGHETLCHERALFGSANTDEGSLATYGVWKAAFIFKIPPTIAPEHAAPLMCGGATVFNALQLFGAVPTSRVGVVGIGGLGHLAIQFAAKMGCEVVVISSSENKKEEAFSLGATEFFATKGVKELAVGEPIDCLIITTSAQPDWTQILPILAPSAMIIPLTADFTGNFSIPYDPINHNELRIQGSLVAARQVQRDMLRFAAHHKIKPEIEKFAMTTNGISKAFAKLEAGKMRYRGVLVVED